MNLLIKAAFPLVGSLQIPGVKFWAVSQIYPPHTPLHSQPKVLLQVPSF